MDLTIGMIKGPDTQMELEFSFPHSALQGPIFGLLSLSLALCRDSLLKQGLENGVSVHLFRWIQMLSSYLLR